MALTEFKIESAPRVIRESNTLRMSVIVHTAILTGDTEWRSFWNEFRLDLQSRIAGIDKDVELHKLQGKLELVDEIDQVFFKVLATKPK